MDANREGILFRTRNSEMRVVWARATEKLGPEETKKFIVGKIAELKRDESILLAMMEEIENQGVISKP